MWVVLSQNCILVSRFDQILTRLCVVPDKHIRQTSLPLGDVEDALMVNRPKVLLDSMYIPRTGQAIDQGANSHIHKLRPRNGNWFKGVQSRDPSILEDSNLLPITHSPPQSLLQ